MVRLEYLAFEHNNAAAELVRQAYDTPPLAFVHSYGCQQNVNDGERIKGVLVDIAMACVRNLRMQTSSSSTPAPCGSTPSSGCSATWVPSRA